MGFFKFVFSKAFIKQLVFAVIVVIILVFLVLYWLKFTTNHNERVDVPNLAKMTLDEAESKLNEYDLRLEILDSANYNPDYPKYSVIEQIPEAGKEVKENRKIYITLNPSGFRKVELPPTLVGKTRRQVEPTLRSLGFEIGTITFRPDISDNVMEMRHKGKKLEPGAELQITSVIDLVVGDGKERYRNQDEDESEENETPIENDNVPE